MKLSPFKVGVAFLLAFAAGVGVGRVSFSINPLGVELRASNSAWKPLEVRHSLALDNIPGSKGAIESLKSRHTAGQLVGQSGDSVFDQLCLAKWTRVGSRYVEFELHGSDSHDGRYGMVVIDLKTGSIVNADFGDLVN